MPCLFSSAIIQPLVCDLGACRHRDGYEYAVRFRAKLTHVSPVWYQLKRAAKDVSHVCHWCVTVTH